MAILRHRLRMSLAFNPVTAGTWRTPEKSPKRARKENHSPRASGAMVASWRGAERSTARVHRPGGAVSNGSNQRPTEPRPAGPYRGVARVHALHDLLHRRRRRPPRASRDYPALEPFRPGRNCSRLPGALAQARTVRSAAVSEKDKSGSHQMRSARAPTPSAGVHGDCGIGSGWGTGCGKNGVCARREARSVGAPKTIHALSVFFTPASGGCRRDTERPTY